MSTINNKINKIYFRDAIEIQFNKFLATKQVDNFVKDIPFLGIDNLIEKYKLYYLKKYSASKAHIMAYIRLKTADLRNIKDYTELPDTNDIIEYTLYPSLTKKELKEIWDAKPNTKMKYAERMKRLEEHKIDRWEKENKPTYEQLKSDLFPRSIISAFIDKMEKKRQEIRNFLIDTYKDPVYKTVKIRFYETINNIESIKEMTIGAIKDPNHIIDKRYSYYYLRDSENPKLKFVFDQIINMVKRVKNIYKDNFICLKIMLDNNRVGCWA